MCGIASIVLSGGETTQAAAEMVEALGVLQHRGQDAAGIITCGERGRMYQCKGNGLVRDVFSYDKVRQLRGSMAVAHVRYPTAGTSSMSEAQPFYVNSPYGIALAHNGNLTNAAPLREYLDITAHRHINTDSDSEVLLNILADNLQAIGKPRIAEEDIFEAVRGLYEKCKGGYACVAMIAGYGVLVFRDPYGIRPCVYGWRVKEWGTDYLVASESAAMHALEFNGFKDVQPGEAIIICKGGMVVKRQIVESPRLMPCIFEFVYFARQDSIIDGVSVYDARLQMGSALAVKVEEQLGRNNDIDVVIPVPDTSRCSALELSFALHKPFREGFNKNRYIGRTFIMPGQQVRAKSVRCKLNAMPLEFLDKNVLIVDDSIVRGTTSREIVAMARRAGAKKVYFASCAPPIRFPNFYGIDIPTRQELVAYRRTEKEVSNYIGADEVIFLSIDALKASVALNSSLTDFECSVFSGDYVTQDVTELYIEEAEVSRSIVKSFNCINTETIGLYNLTASPH